jgi:hypothetical protein
MLILTAAFFIGGLISYSQARGFGRSAVQTQGVVTKLVPMDEEDLKAVFGDDFTHSFGTMYCYAYAFHDLQGTEHQAVSRSGSWPAKYRIGDTVNLLYLPERPEQSELKEDFDPWGEAVFAWQLGVVSLFIGLVLIVPARFIGKRRHEPTLAHST